VNVINCNYTISQSHSLNELVSINQLIHIELIWSSQLG